MADRIVVSFASAVPDEDALVWLDRARAVHQRAVAGGALLSAWSARSLSFDFAANAVDEATSLAAAALDEEVGGRAIGIGIAFGDLTRAGDPATFGALATGPALIASERVAQLAGPAEILFDPEAPAHVLKGLATRIDARGVLVLQAHSPRRDTEIDGLAQSADQVVRVHVPPLPPLSQLSHEMRRAVSGLHALAPLASDLDGPPTVRRPPPIPVGGASGSAADFGDVELETLDTAETEGVSDPDPLHADIALADETHAPTWSDEGDRPSTEVDPIAEAARRAFVKGDIAELDRLAEELKNRREHEDLAERLHGFVALSRGAKADGLRTLRAAASQETRPAQRIRALLAYGVALASAGRTEPALLAGLGALARARETDDRQGEHVCARFLARLSAAAGHERAAQTWTRVAEGTGDNRA